MDIDYCNCNLYPINKIFCYEKYRNLYLNDKIFCYENYRNWYLNDKIFCYENYRNLYPNDKIFCYENYRNWFPNDKIFCLLRKSSQLASGYELGVFTGWGCSPCASLRPAAAAWLSWLDLT